MSTGQLVLERLDIKFLFADLPKNLICRVITTGDICWVNFFDSVIIQDSIFFPKDNKGQDHLHLCLLEQA